MGITALQREQRVEGIGSSDAAAIIGVNPWANAADVRLRKLQLVRDEEEAPSELAEIGIAIEGGIASLASKRLGVPLFKPTATYRLSGTPLLANLDRQLAKAARGQPLCEVKDSGLDDDWGVPGTDQVPPYVLVQVVHQMLCSDAPEAHVARLGRGFNRGLFMFEIGRSDAVLRLMDTMTKLLPLWWQRHIVNRDPLPEGAPPPSIEMLKRVDREPKSTVPIKDELVTTYHAAVETRKAAEWAEDLAKAKLIDALGPNEGGVCSLGVFTYREENAGEKIDKELLRSIAPDVYAKVAKSGTRMMPRWKPARK